MAVNSKTGCRLGRRSEDGYTTIILCRLCGKQINKYDNKYGICNQCKKSRKNEYLQIVTDLESEIDIETINILYDELDDKQLKYLSGNQKIPLSNGQQDCYVSDLVNTNFWVYSLNTNKMIVPAEARCHVLEGNFPLISAKLDNKKNIVCSPNNMFVKRSGELIDVSNLKYQDSLMPFNIDEDLDGYLYVQQPYGCNLKHYPYHRFLASYVLGEDIEGLVVHHIDGNKHNNRLDNLKVMTFSEHSKLHRDLDDIHLFECSEFKSKRKSKLEAVNYYHDKYYEQRKRIGAQNLRNYLENNPEHFAKVVEENAKRFSEIAKRDNSNPRIQAMRYLSKLLKIANEIYPNEINEESWNSARTIMYNGPYYSTALNHLNKYSMTWDDLLNKDCWESKVANNHKLVGLSYYGRTESVYCIEVMSETNFAVSSGIFLSSL